MRPVLAVSVLVLGLALVAQGSQPKGQSPPTTDAASERDRITRHLTQAERRLRAADVSHLDAARREARSRALDYLAEYRRRAVYPHNHDTAGRKPVFVDERGVRCAMAYLIARSGEDALVERVAASANTATIHELRHDPGLRRWLERNGMTVAEAAMVQPAYEGRPPEVGNSSFLDDVRDHYPVVGAFTLVADALAIYLVQRRDALERPAAVAGIMAGAAGGALAMTVLHDGTDRAKDALAVGNLTLAVTAVGVGIHALLRNRDRDPPFVRAMEEHGIRLQVSPAVIRADRPRPGVGATFRF